MNEEEFNYLTLKYGGRYEPKMDEAGMLILDKLIFIREFVKRIKSEVPSLPEIYVDIIDNHKLDASAMLDGRDKYYIGINKGAILKLDKIFSSAVKNEKFYKPLNMKKENSQKYKELCFKYALEFLVVHEISHIRCGHLRLNLNNNLNCSFLHESYSSISSKDNILLQTLEMDADSCGIATVINRLMVDGQETNNNFLQDLPIILMKFSLKNFIKF